MLFYACFNGSEWCWLSWQNTFEEKTQENGGAHLNSPSTSLWRGTKLGVKVVKTRRELILPRAMVTLMINGMYSLVRLIPTRSDQALRTLRITSALFVFVAGGEKAKHRDLVLGERQTRARSGAKPSLHIECRFFTTMATCWLVILCFWQALGFFYI